MRTDGRPCDARPRVWAILNVTPDSFSDGGATPRPEDAIPRARELLAEGADVLDVGGESTRPGARPVPPAEEEARVVPVIRALAAEGIGPLSIDTRKASVAAAALSAGASIVNDVSAGLHDPRMVPLVAERRAGFVVMHMQGTPETMQQAPRYEDVVAEVRDWLRRRAEDVVSQGVSPERLWVDPGIGFGKTFEHNLLLLRALERLVADGRRVLLGASRKSFLGRLTGREAPARLGGSLACAARGFAAGVDALRVHDVQATVDLLDVLAAIA